MCPDLSPLAARHALRDVYVFGRRAARFSEREPKPDPPPASSDLDIAVQPLAGHALSPDQRVTLNNELERLFEVPRVDLVILSEASTLLALEVIRGELLYTSDPLAQSEQELYILRRAGDLAHHLDERTRLTLEACAGRLRLS